jgi:PKHD-type hydroxylase
LDFGWEIERGGFWRQDRDMASLYLAVPGAFAPQECDAIIAMADGAEAAPVWGDAGYHVDRSQRDVPTSLHRRGPASLWLFDRLDALFAEAALAFALPVGPISEPVQILRYDVGNHFRTWHSDAGRDAQDRRRISMSVELSERGDYDGGELEIVPERVGALRTLPRGSAQLFPSRALHRVTPVTRGRRWSLVAWTGLEP